MADETFEASVVQYMRPDGRAAPKKTNLPIQYKEAYGSMVSAGYNFSAEIFEDGEVSLGIENDTNTIDGEVTMNGPWVQLALCKMLERESWK